MRWRNTSGRGALDIQGVGLVEDGAEFDTIPEEAAGIAGQVDNFTPVDPEAIALRDTLLGVAPGVPHLADDTPVLPDPFTSTAPVEG